MNDTPNTDNGSKRSYILKAWEELGIKIKKNDCSYDRPWDVDILLHRLCFCLSRLLWNHSGQRPNDHSGGKSPSWRLQMFLRFLFVWSLWSRIEQTFLALNHKYCWWCFYYVPRIDWDIAYGHEQQWNWSEYEFCSGSDYEFAQGVIMNDEGDAVEFSPRNARKVWSSEKKEVIGFLFFSSRFPFRVQTLKTWQ